MVPVLFASPARTRYVYHFYKINSLFVIAAITEPVFVKEKKVLKFQTLGR